VAVCVGIGIVIGITGVVDIWEWIG